MKELYENIEKATGQGLSVRVTGLSLASQKGDPTPTLCILDITFAEMEFNMSFPIIDLARILEASRIAAARFPGCIPTETE